MTAAGRPVFPMPAAPSSSPVFRFRVPLLLALAATLPLWLPACSNVRTLIAGTQTGARLDRTERRAKKPLDKKQRRVVVAVVADAAGRVVDTRIVQSSGSEAVDEYVRAYAPPEAAPSSVTTLELLYSAAEGFSQPKVLTVEPVAVSAR